MIAIFGFIRRPLKSVLVYFELTRLDVPTLSRYLPGSGRALKKLHVTFCALLANTALGSALFAQEQPAPVQTTREANDTMRELLFPGRKLVVESANYRLEVVFSEDGTYKASNGSSGTWAMDGDRLCTVTKARESGCGILPSALKLNDRWSTTDSKEAGVTATIA